MAILTIRAGGTCVRYPFDPPQPLDKLLEAAGFPLRRPCGGRGVCGKCAVLVRGAVTAPSEIEERLHSRLACQCVMLGDGEAELTLEHITQIQSAEISDIRPGVPMEGLIGAAVDIGTTTVVLRRFDLQTGTLLSERGMENPQVQIAADVIGRIDAAMHGESEVLQDKIFSALQMLLRETGGPVDTMVVTGNTTMLYLLTGRDPTCLSRLPFQADTLFDCEIPVMGIPSYLPPCMNAFVGADITCAVFASGMCRGGTALLCDIGTNGEIALWKGGVLYVTSTAAGPAFEGAGISCGLSSVPGAIDCVWLEDGALRVHTIGNAPVRGVCGSGLIDAVACLLKAGVIDESGTMDIQECFLSEGASLTQKDIRMVQLAKAAIAAGIRTLLEVSHTSFAEIEQFYLAGGFGSHLNTASAAAIGLVPRELTEKTKVIGNAALTGATKLLLDTRALEDVRRIASGSRHWNLGGNPVFNAFYTEEMLFPAAGL